MEKLIELIREREERARKREDLLLELIKELKESREKPTTAIKVEYSDEKDDKKAALILHAANEYIASQLTPFVFAPQEGLTFDKWLERASTVFASDRARTLSESDKCQIIITESYHSTTISVSHKRFCQRSRKNYRLTKQPKFSTDCLAGRNRSSPYGIACYRHT